jgi:hypothetical protein
MPIFQPYSIISISNEFFITAFNGIYKSDKYLNLVNSYIKIGASYVSIYHNSTSDILYIASNTFNRIDLFYHNLSFISSINFTNQPNALTEKSGKLYVGLYGGVISVIENNLVVKTITTLCTYWINSIIIDTNELMAVLCYTDDMLYLYSTNGSYTGKNMNYPLYKFMNYDLNGHFILAGESQIDIYY